MYQEALAIEFQQLGIPNIRENNIPGIYKGIDLRSSFKEDFICYNNIVIELKALSTLNVDHSAQVINYLKTTGLKLGLLFNFGTASLQHQRYVL